MAIDEGIAQRRPETGPMKFGDDWTGLFIRGDNAAYYAYRLRTVLELLDRAVLSRAVSDAFTRSSLEGLIRLLGSSNEFARDEEGKPYARQPEGLQHMLPFESAKMPDKEASHVDR